MGEKRLRKREVSDSHESHLLFRLLLTYRRDKRTKCPPGQNIPRQNLPGQKSPQLKNTWGQNVLELASLCKVVFKDTLTLNF